MTREARITVEIPGHGTYTAPAWAVDVMISEHLPSSPERLRSVVVERSGLDPEAWAPVHDVAAFLVMLADWHAAKIANELSAERRQAEPPIIGYHERPGDQLALGEVVAEPIQGTTRSCPRCGTHTRWTGYAWEHVPEGETGSGQLSCPIPTDTPQRCGCKVWPCQHEGAYLLDGEPLTTELA
jgi:hypothetical protein